MAPCPAYLLSIFAQKALTLKNYSKIEKKGLARDRNIFLAPGPATHKTGTDTPLYYKFSWNMMINSLSIFHFHFHTFLQFNMSNQSMMEQEEELNILREEKLKREEIDLLSLNEDILVKPISRYTF